MQSLVITMERTLWLLVWIYLLITNSFNVIIYQKRVTLILSGVFLDQQKKFERFCVFGKKYSRLIAGFL